MKTQNIFTGEILDLINQLEAENDPKKEAIYLNFAGEKNAGEVAQKLQNGCPTLAEKYERAESFAAPLTTTGTGYNYANEGLFFDVPTFLSGQPEHWFNECEAMQTAPAKDLFICLNVPFWVTEADIFDKLKKIIDFIDESEAKGQRLNIYAKIASYENKRIGKKYKIEKSTVYTFDLLIKKDSDPINLQQLIYLIASPVLLRYCYLYMLNRYINDDSNSIGAYELEAANFNENSFYIPSITYDVINENVPITGPEKRRRLDYKKISLTAIYPHLCQ